MLGFYVNIEYFCTRTQINIWISTEVIYAKLFYYLGTKYNFLNRNNKSLVYLAVNEYSRIYIVDCWEEIVFIALKCPLAADCKLK